MGRVNDFNILSIYIQNKDVAAAMRVLREKSEFAVRKILEKLKIRATTQTGRAFCSGLAVNRVSPGNIQHESFSTRRSSHYPERQPATSRCSRYGQASRTSGHVYRPHQYGVSVASLAGDVCVSLTYADVRHMDMHDLYAFFSFSREIRKKVVPDLPDPPRRAVVKKHNMCHSFR